MTPGGRAEPEAAARTTADRLSEVTLGRVQRIDGPVTLVAHDPVWPSLFAREADRIRAALKERALHVHHVGSTSVPGLTAKPIVDILLVVPDSADEAAYLPPLLDAGYLLRIREPEWHEHRLLKGPDTDVNLHVFSGGDAEIDRMLRLRDRLRSDAGARERYAAAKRELAARHWAYLQDYADAKSAVIESLLVADPPPPTGR